MPSCAHPTTTHDGRCGECGESLTAYAVGPAERDRYREALETITHWWLGHDPEPWRPDIVAYQALHNVGPAEAMERLRQEHRRA